MKEYKYPIHINQLFPHMDVAALINDMGYALNEVVILDIETTGFHRTYDVISVLGLIYFEAYQGENTGYIVQLFNENGKEDASIISRLQYYLKNCTLLITFNGDRFDIPFLLEKNRMHTVGNHPLFELNAMTSLDLYKVSKLQFPDLKKCTLKSVEEKLHIHRDDLISGKDAAQSYKNYLKTKEIELCHPILQHNYEDILNLIPLFYSLYQTSYETNSDAMLSFPSEIYNGRITQISYKANQLIIKGEYFTQDHPNYKAEIRSEFQSNHLLIDPIFEKYMHHCDHTIDFNAHQLVIRFKCIHAAPYHLIDFFNGALPLTTLNNAQLNSLIISTEDQLDSKKIKQFSFELFHLILKTYF